MFAVYKMRGFAAAVALVLLATPSAAATLDERLAPCLECHGETGQSARPDVPSLGAQPAFYVLTQLVMFRERMRPIEPMTEMLMGATDDDLRKLGEAISRLPPPPPATGSADQTRIERARALIREHRCNFCHDVNFAGYENVPRLAGQREDYLLKALHGYRDNTRRAYDPQMANVVVPLGDKDISDLAYFLARAK